MSVIPRLDLNPVFFTETGGGGEFTLGNTSLYSLFEGNITDNLSFSVANHWAGFDSVHDVFATTKDLYAYTLRSDSTNWLDWAYLTYSVGNFAFTLGKDIITTGGLEFDDYDFEVHPSLVSSYWQNLARASLRQRPLQLLPGMEGRTRPAGDHLERHRHGGGQG